MKTLFIGHYKEGSGWSQMAINSILAANTSMDVVCRNIKLTDYQSKVHPTIMQLENRPLQDIDVCIQNVLPHHIIGTQKFRKNIAYFVGESNTVKYNHWLTYLKLVDEVWVPNHTLKNNFINDGLPENTIKVIPYAFDLDRYTKQNAKFDFGNDNHKFKFYYIADLNDRKNIESVIRCFHSEFHPYEPVMLVLKVKKFGASSDSVQKYMNNMCGTIKKEMRLYPNISQYHKEIIITEDVSSDHIDALHNTCDCFIGPSHGEGWSIPAFDAMCFGKTPICSNEGGPKEFIDPNNLNTGYLIDGNYSVCNHSDPAFPEIFTGREEWFQPSESLIKKAMRYYYDNKDNIDRTAGLQNAQQFSYELIGKVMRDAIND
jgi:glycosyltransferase involved in cell wall biosynthesis